MPSRELVIALLRGVFVGAPIVVVATVLDWPAISFYGAVLVGCLVYAVGLDRIERNARHQ
jgi:uncharacterized membrane protein YbhN (UPF0104 family)